MPAAGGPTRAGTGTPSAGRLPAVRPPWRYERSAEETAPCALKPLQKHDRALSVVPAYRPCRCPPGISSRKASLGISTCLTTTLGHTPAQIHVAALNSHTHTIILQTIAPVLRPTDTPAIQYKLVGAHKLNAIIAFLTDRNDEAFSCQLASLPNQLNESTTFHDFP